MVRLRRLAGPGKNHFAGSANPPLDQQFQVGGTTLIFPETVLECVFEPVEAEMVRAT
jgi:hypothetical protein